MPDTLLLQAASRLRMPNLTPNTILQRSIPDAISDRVGLIDAYQGIGEWADAARADIRAMQALRGRKLDKLDEAERATAFKVLCCAESWNESLAYAMGPAGAKVLRAAQRIRQTRLTTFGKSALEAMAEQAVAVDIREAPTILAALAASAPARAAR